MEVKPGPPRDRLPFHRSAGRAPRGMEMAYDEGLAQMMRKDLDDEIGITEGALADDDRRLAWCALALVNAASLPPK